MTKTKTLIYFKIMHIGSLFSQFFNKRLQREEQQVLLQKVVSLTSILLRKRLVKTSKN